MFLRALYISKVPSTRQCSRCAILSITSHTQVTNETTPKKISRSVHGVPKFPPPHNPLVPQNGPLDYSSRNFTYMVVGAAGVVGTIGIKNVVGDFIAALTPGRHLLAAANIEVKLDDIKEGQVMTFDWRGKPLIVWHREQKEIAEVRSTPLPDLKDPQPDEDRVQKPEYLVVLGICTHLGCVPIHHSGLYHGFFCPCHGSHYDASGRIRTGPAPKNLEVPPYHFAKSGDNMIVVGVSQEDAK